MTAKTVTVSQAVFRLYRIRTELVMMLVEGNSVGQEGMNERGFEVFIEKRSEQLYRSRSSGVSDSGHLLAKRQLAAS